MLVLTCSSIPPRFKYLPQFYAALEKQTQKPDRVELWVARNYRRFPGELPSLPELPEWVDVNWIEDDLGPATKVLPAAQKWRGKNVDLIYCDDDRVYDRHWAARLQQARKERPDMAHCENGFTLDWLGFDREVPLPGPAPQPTSHKVRRFYNLARLFSLGLWRPHFPGHSQAGYVDVAEGFCGVCISPDWFADEDANIPDVLWTVDDVWLSGQLARRGISIHTTVGSKRSLKFKDSHLAAPLFTHVEDGSGRLDANRACVQYFRDTYGVWT